MLGRLIGSAGAKAGVWAAQLQRQRCVRPSASKMAASPLGFNFDQVKCQLFFFFIRKSFNRFPPVALRSQEEVQGRKIRPILSFGFAETGYIYPINSRPVQP